MPCCGALPISHTQGGKAATIRAQWFKENGINPYIWCVAGGAVGWLAGLLMGSAGRVVLIENVLVGVFGAFVGAEVIAPKLGGIVADAADFSIRSLALALAGAVVMLLILRLMRSRVGPMGSGKKPQRKRP